MRPLSVLRRRILVATFALLACPSAVLADYDAGQRAWDAGQPAQALEQWRSAADAGDDRAMLALGRLYVQGLGAPQDFVEAHKWLNLAASRGNAEAAGERDALAERMTPQQVAAAQERASSWPPGDAVGQAAAVDPAAADEDVGPPPVEALREAQSLLAALGYAPGPADGVWGARSMQAYHAFLQDADQPVVDILTPANLQAMRDVAGGRDVDLATAASSTEPASPPDPAPPASLPDALVRAAQAGDLLALKAALETDVDPDARDDRGWTALMHAANKGHAQLVPPLIKAGAELNVQALDGATALFIAALHGHAGIIGHLMEAGADASTPGPRGRTPRDLAQARYGDVETARRNGESVAVQALIQGVTVAEAEELARVPKTFRDCDRCPEMVVVPVGSFMMGSPDSEEDRYNDEGPVRRVTMFAPFAVGKYEVTFAEWGACWADGGCRRDPRDEGWGRGNRPVINVSWKDAQAYVGWLSQQTGKQYRLLSESEWEYAARAGSQTRYAWGDGIGRNRANCRSCGSRWDGESTAPVGSFAANAFGLHDLHGNVWEWVEDCWNDSYRGARVDGAAWEVGDCSRRVTRGGSWYSSPGHLRSASRVKDGTTSGSFHIGFRVARTVTP